MKTNFAIPKPIEAKILPVEKPVVQKSGVNENILKVIEQGGSASKMLQKAANHQAAILVSFTLRLPQPYLDAIADAQNMRKPLPGKKISISKQDYMILALKEKLQSDGIEIVE